MHADSAYVIGASHEVCQDYARTQRAPDGSGGCWAVVCDGCSSSPDTDVGARLLAATALAYVASPDILREAHQRRLRSVFCEEALDATLLRLQARPWQGTASEFGTISVEVYGDGVVVARDRATGVLTVYEICYPDGLPAYLNYNMNSTRANTYCRLSQGRVVRRNGELWGCTPGKDLDLWVPSRLSLPVAAWDLVAVMSDGFTSFTRKGPDGATAAVPLAEVVEHLFKFKLYGGLFVKRRLKRFLKDARSWGWTHDDDLGIAAIYLGDDHG